MWSFSSCGHPMIIGAQGTLRQKKGHSKRAPAIGQVAYPTSAPSHIRKASLGTSLTLLGLSLGNMPLERPRHTKGPSLPRRSKLRLVNGFSLIPLSPPHTHHRAASGSRSRIHGRLHKIIDQRIVTPDHLFSRKKHIAKLLGFLQETTGDQSCPQPAQSVNPPTAPRCLRRLHPPPPAEG